MNGENELTEPQIILLVVSRDVVLSTQLLSSKCKNLKLFSPVSSVYLVHTVTGPVNMEVVDRSK